VAEIKLADGSWKCFRGMGGTEPGAAGEAGGLYPGAVLRQLSLEE
jgi:hypothetical protein